MAGRSVRAVEFGVLRLLGDDRGGLGRRGGFDRLAVDGAGRRDERRVGERRARAHARMGAAEGGAARGDQVGGDEHHQAALLDALAGGTERSADEGQVTEDRDLVVDGLHFFAGQAADDDGGAVEDSDVVRDFTRAEDRMEDAGGYGWLFYTSDAGD